MFVVVNESSRLLPVVRNPPSCAPDAEEEGDGVVGSNGTCNNSSYAKSIVPPGNRKTMATTKRTTLLLAVVALSFSVSWLLMMSRGHNNNGGGSGGGMMGIIAAEVGKPPQQVLTLVVGHNDDETTTKKDNNGVVVDGDDERVVYIIRHGEKHWDPANATAYNYACLSSAGYERANHLVGVFLLHNNNTDDESSAFPLLRPPKALFSFDYDNGDLDCRDKDGLYRTQATLKPLSAALGNLPIHNRTGSKPDLCGFGRIGDAPVIPEPKKKQQQQRNPEYDDRFCHPPVIGGGSVHDFGICCNIGAAAAIRSELFSGSNGSVLVAWEHANIRYLVEALVTSDGDGDDSKKSLHQERKNLPSLYWPNEDFDTIYALGFDPHTHEFTGIDTTTFHQGFRSSTQSPVLRK